MPQRGGWRKGRGRLDAPIDHLSADRLADIISTDRVQSTEVEPATMRLSEAPQEESRTDVSGPADPFLSSARSGWDQAVEDWELAEPELADPEIEEPEAEAPELEEPELQIPELVAPEPDALPPLWQPPAYDAPPSVPAVTRKKSSRKKSVRKKSSRKRSTAWVGRHRRAKSGKVNLRSLSLTSILLAVMGVLTLIVVATAMF